MTRLLPVCLLLAVAAGACGSAETTVTGVVVEVDGDLITVDRFAIVDDEGTRLTFTPAEGIAFHDSAPLSHIRDHLRSGEAVVVVYEALADGTLIAFEVRDAG